MGMDVNGIIAYGIKLTEDEEDELTKDSDDGAWGFFEDLFDPYEKKAKYPNLYSVAFGSSDVPTWVIALKYSYSSDWDASPLEEADLEVPSDGIQLQQFCKEFNIEYDPRWWFGGHFG